MKPPSSNAEVYNPFSGGNNAYKIKELLRKRYGFSGVVCTDWMVLNEGMKEGKRSCGWGKVIENPEVELGEKAFMAIMAGVDQMGGCSNPDVLVRAYEIGCEKVGNPNLTMSTAS